MVVSKIKASTGMLCYTYFVKPLQEKENDQ